MRIFWVVLMAALMAGCVSTRSRHGYVPERGDEELEAEVGVDTRESVLARYGEPTVRPALSDDVWYYISSAMNARAFYTPETIQREIVAFSFDDDGYVADIETYELADGRRVDIVGRETPTRGKELSFIEQLIGGVGAMPGIPGGPGGPGGGPR